MSVRLRSPCAAMAAALLVPVLACAAPDSGDAPSPPSPASAPGWAFSATGMYYFPPDQDNFLLVIGTADRGSLHLEARYNYEALDTGSLFAGWTFSGGNADLRADANVRRGVR